VDNGNIIVKVFVKYKSVMPRWTLRMHSYKKELSARRLSAGAL
jgi:hypothetical protein